MELTTCDTSVPAAERRSIVFLPYTSDREPRVGEEMNWRAENNDPRKPENSLFYYYEHQNLPRFENFYDVSQSFLWNLFRTSCSRIHQPTQFFWVTCKHPLNDCCGYSITLTAEENVVVPLIVWHADKSLEWREEWDEKIVETVLRWQKLKKFFRVMMRSRGINPNTFHVICVFSCHGDCSPEERCPNTEWFSNNGIGWSVHHQTINYQSWLYFHRSFFIVLHVWTKIGHWVIFGTVCLVKEKKKSV